MSALPAWAIAVIVVGGVLLALVIADWASRPRTFSLAGRTVVITGGSSGIGKATAVAVLRAGGHVALLARKQALLDEAARELAPLSRGGTLRITTHSVDVTNEAQVKAAVSAITAAHGGRVDGIVASAGVSLPKRFEETTAEEFAWLYNLNVIGCRNVIAACLPHMGGADAAAGGRIVLVSSQAGQSGIYGYSAYSVSCACAHRASNAAVTPRPLHLQASKFALNGLAQALQHEVYSRHILISQCFPPDTDTPLFAEENRSKPPLTHMLSQATALVQPQVVGDAIVGGMTHWRPFIAVGFDGWMLSQLCSGFAPAGTLGLAIIQVRARSRTAARIRESACTCSPPRRLAGCFLGPLPRHRAGLCAVLLLHRRQA